MSLRFSLALLAGKLSSAFISVVAKDRGTTMPGRIALKIDPQFTRHVKGLAMDRTIFVTGTNGKSTTTNLLAHVFRTAGYKVRCNLEGANLLTGVVAALIKDASLAGRMRSDYLLLETDERFLPIIHKQLPARHICITNVQKDQVQRNGEPDIIYRKLRSVISADTTLYINDDEPYAASLARFAGQVVRYGVEENARSFTKQADPFSVTMPCPLCAAPIRFHHYNIDNIGPFACSNEACGFGSSPAADYRAEQVDFAAQTFSAEGQTYRFGYSTPYFLYCYIAALAVARRFGVEPAALQQAFDSFVNIGGRMEDLHYGSKTIHYMRMKQENPETLQSALNVIASDPTPKVFLLGLEELVDFHPHYTNTFYAFDCSFRGLIDSGVEKFICFSDAVAYDTALRLRYEGADPDRICVLPTNDDATILEALDACTSDNVYLITWLKKFNELSSYTENLRRKVPEVQ